MIRALLVLVLIGLAVISSGVSADETFAATYAPEGPVVAGQELIVSQNIFVGERFWSGYTLEFDTDLTDPVWEIDLVTENRTTQTWKFPYAHATISGFTISTADRDTWLVTRLTGTPAGYDTGKEITLWQMKVKMQGDATKETMGSAPVLVVSPPAPTAGPLPVTPTATTVTIPATTTTTGAETPTPVTTVPVTVETTATPPATPQSTFGCCGLLLLFVAGALLLWRS